MPRGTPAVTRQNSYCVGAGLPGVYWARSSCAATRATGARNAHLAIYECVHGRLTLNPGRDGFIITSGIRRRVVQFQRHERAHHDLDLAHRAPQTVDVARAPCPSR